MLLRPAAKGVSQKKEMIRKAGDTVRAETCAERRRGIRIQSIPLSEAVCEGLAKIGGVGGDYLNGNHPAGF
jgi:hypothetical protein